MYYIWSKLQQSPYSTIAVRAVQQTFGLWGLCSMDLGRRLSRERQSYDASSPAFRVHDHTRKGKVPGSGSDPPTPTFDNGVDFGCWFMWVLTLG